MFSCTVPLHYPGHNHVNISWSGTYLLKKENVRLLLKKPSLDIDVLAHYRPVSYHTQLSKTLEKVIAQQLLNHTDHMSEMYQSAYKPQHSTAPELLCVCEDLKKALDRKNGTALVRIDISAELSPLTTIYVFIDYATGIEFLVLLLNG